MHLFWLALALALVGSAPTACKANAGASVLWEPRPRGGTAISRALPFARRQQPLPKPYYGGNEQPRPQAFHDGNVLEDEPESVSPTVPFQRPVGSSFLMTPAEQALLKSKFATATHYFEFGAGGSTYEAVVANIPCITSVDSSPKWMQKVKDNIGERTCFQMFAIDMGPTNKTFGYPIGDAHKHLWPNYPMAFHLHGQEADLVLVDGRFRVACALMTWLSGKPTTTVMIHDYLREAYHAVEEVYDVVEQAEALVVLKPNAEKHASEQWRKRAIEMFISYQYVTA